jgi:hypothetical protein
LLFAFSLSLQLIILPNFVSKGSCFLTTFVRVFFWRRDPAVPAGHGKIVLREIAKIKTPGCVVVFGESVAFRAVASMALAGFDLDLDSY